SPRCHTERARARSVRAVVPILAGILLGGAACGVFGGASAQAALLFSHNFVTVGAELAPTAPTILAFSLTSVNIGFNNTLAFRTNPEESGLDAGVPGGTQFVLGDLLFNPVNRVETVNFTVNFIYVVTITDTTSGNAQTVNFGGQISGTANGAA